MTESIKVTAGRYQLEKATLKTLQGDVEIAGLVAKIVVRESIYQYFPTFDITVVDGLNYFEDYTLSGNELLEVTLSVLNENNKPAMTVTKYLRVIGYDGYYRSTRVQGYVLQCMEDAIYDALTKRISATKEGTMSDILQQLLNDIGYTVTVNGNKSVGNHRIIFPNLIYTEALEMVIRKAEIPDHSTLHLYGTLWGDAYVSTYKWMVTQKPAFDYVMSYLQQSEVNSKQFFDEELHSIKQMSSIMNLSNPDVSATGGNTSRFHEIDCSKKFYEITGFNIQDHGGSLPKLYGKHFYDKQYGLGGLESFTFVRATNTMAFADSGELYNINEFTPDFLMKKASVLQNQFGMKHRLTVAGNQNVKAGDVIEIDLPKAQDPQRNKEQDPSTDEWVSGKYLVTEIQHEMSDFFKYVMHITCQRDSRIK